MRISLEAVFLTNFAIDALLLALAARWLGAGRARGILAAAILGGIYALLAACGPLSGLRRLPGLLAAALAMSGLAFFPDGARAAARGFGLLLAFALLLGGLRTLVSQMTALSPTAALALSGLGCASVLACTPRPGQRRAAAGELRVEIATSHGRVQFTALVDTGNRLREPISGRPVLIAEEALLRPLLPPGFRADIAAPGFRLVGFGGLGGSGQLACFWPSALRVRRGSGWQRAPRLWVAIYPGRLPGAARALAPGEMGEWIQARQRHKKQSISDPQGSAKEA